MRNEPTAAALITNPEHTGEAATYAPFTPAGYRIVERIYEAERASVYRGIRESDGRRVILKVLRGSALTPGQVARYVHEHRILEHLHGSGAVAAYELRQETSLVTLVIEDFGGTSLRKLLQARAPFLADIGRKIAL